MRTAICFSGELRSIDRTYALIQTNIISKFPNSEVFIHIWNDDPDIDKLSTFSNITKVHIESRKTFDEKFYNNHKRPEVNIQGFLRQLYCISQCNKLKMIYEKEHGFTYDIVCRIRPDILIENDTHIEIKEFNKSKIYIPNHDDHHGYNDRFYYGSSENMDILNTRFDLVDWYFNMGGRIHYETFLKFLILYNNIEITRIPLRFGLLRVNGDYLPPIDEKLVDIENEL